LSTGYSPACGVGSDRILRIRVDRAARRAARYCRQRNGEHRSAVTLVTRQMRNLVQATASLARPMAISDTRHLLSASYWNIRISFLPSHRDSSNRQATGHVSAAFAAETGGGG